MARRFFGGMNMIAEVLQQVADKHKNIVVAVRPPKDPNTGTNVFMGIGVAQRKGTISPGLGIGTVGMAITAVETARAIQNRGSDSTINVLVADGHAERFSHGNNNEIRLSADSAANILQRLFLALGEPSINLIRSSEQTRWPLNGKTYEDVEAADIERARTVLQAGVKVGWQSHRQPLFGRSRNDEKHFDQFAMKQNAELRRRMGFLRTTEGIKPERGMDGKHQSVPPYIGSPNFALGQAIPDVRRRLNELGAKSDFHNWLVRLGNAITRLERRSPRTVDPFEQIQKMIDACKE